MVAISKQLKRYIADKVAGGDPLWQNLKVITGCKTKCIGDGDSTCHWRLPHHSM
jgi:hypothetical protein